jgi:cold shock CspA family protein
MDIAHSQKVRRSEGQKVRRSEGQKVRRSEGQKVEFEIVQGDKGLQADNVQVV